MKHEFSSPSYNVEKKISGKSKTVLCTAPLHFLKDIKEKLEANFNVIYAFRASLQDVKELIGGVQAWIVDPGADYAINQEVLSLNKGLQIIITPSTGSDHVDLEYCKQNKINFFSLKGEEKIIKNIHASAEFSFALLLALIRRLVPAVIAAENGFWREIEDELRGIEINQKTVGLIGYGRIGKKMAHYCQAFGAKVIVFDPYTKSSVNKKIKKVEILDDLLKLSDIVCLHVHLEDRTRNMFGEKQFLQMKKGSYFLNTSRGGLVDERAMLKVLENKYLAGAAVDVISGEQVGNFHNHEVIQYARKNDNLLVSPHIAGLTVDSQRKAANFAIEVLAKFFG